MGNKFLALESTLNTILNINIGKEVRLNELGKIEEYSNGLIQMSDEKAKALAAVIEAMRNEINRKVTNEECIGGYNIILKELLSINRSLRGAKCVVFGDNWLSEEVKKEMQRKNYCVFDWHAVNPAYINEFDLYILCNEPLKVYDLAAIEDKEKILKIWDFLKYKFVVFPAFYETYVKFKKQCNSKVKCIVTGNANIKNAVRDELIHTKTISLSNSAQDIFYDFKMFCHAYEEIKELKYVIIGLAPYSLRYDASKSKVEWRRCLVYYPIVETMHNCEDAEQLISLFESENKKMKMIFSEDYINSLYDLFEEQTGNDAANVIEVFDEEKCAKENQALNIREISELYNRPFKDILLENQVLLEEYARFCKGKGIKVIFLIPPYTKWYKDHMKRTYYEELIKIVKRLAEKYEAEIVDMLDVDLPDCCFADYANMNSIGAVKVASYINEVIDR